MASSGHQMHPRGERTECMLLQSLQGWKVEQSKCQLKLRNGRNGPERSNWWSLWKFVRQKHSSETFKLKAFDAALHPIDLMAKVRRRRWHRTHFILTVATVNGRSPYWWHHSESEFQITWQSRSSTDHRAKTSHKLLIQVLSITGATAASGREGVTDPLDRHSMASSRSIPLWMPWKVARQAEKVFWEGSNLEKLPSSYNL